MGLDKFKSFLKGDTGSDSSDIKETQVDEDEYYDTGKEAFKDINNASKMILFEPRAYSESQQIADFLKKRSAVVVNLKRVTPDQAKRIVDFLSGTLYAINGGLQKLGTGIFLCTPNNVDVEGTITDENKEKTLKKDIKLDEEEVDW